MDLRQKAQGAPYHLATSFEECPLGRFWVVQLSCGLEIYQSEDNPTYDEPSAWMRLKQFCNDHDVQPMNMAVTGKDLDPSRQINLDPQADAYYYARRLRKLMAANAGYSGYQDSAQGVGQLHGKKLRIVWEFDDGRGFDIEERDLDDHPKSHPVSLIHK